MLKQQRVTASAAVAWHLGQGRVEILRAAQKISPVLVQTEMLAPLFVLYHLHCFSKMSVFPPFRSVDCAWVYSRSSLGVPAQTTSQQLLNQTGRLTGLAAQYALPLLRSRWMCFCLPPGVELVFLFPLTAAMVGKNLPDLIPNSQNPPNPMYQSHATIH